MSSNTPLQAATERSRIDKPADRGKWLATRRGWFNASAAAVLWGRHPFMTPGDYAATKLTDTEDAPPTRAMQRGVRLEDVIAQWWADEHRCSVVEPSVLYTAGRVMATVDRIITRSTGTPAIGTPVEIKTTAIPTARPAEHWIDQCQAIMLAVDAPELELVWFDSTLDIQAETIRADANHQQTLLARAERFMAAIDLGFAPDWVMLSASNIAAIHDKPVDMVDLDADGLDLVRTYSALRQIRLDTEADEAKVKDQLARLFLNKEIAAYDGMPVLSWKAVTPSRRFDVARFRADHPDLHDAYLVDGPKSRRFHLLIGAT